MKKVTDISPEIKAISRLLLDCPIGGVVTIDQLSSAIGQDIRNVRYLIYNAMGVVLDETGAVFSSVRKVGYQRLTSEEVKDIGAHCRSRIRSTARIGQRRMKKATAKSNSMTPDDRREVMRECGILGMLEHMSRDKSKEAVKQQEEDAPLPYAVVVSQMHRFFANGVKTE